MQSKISNQNISEGLRKIINSHGYGFQYSVLKNIEKLSNEHKIKWIFEVAEFPVEVKDVPYHIDFVLRNKKRPLYLVAECKRVNPALSNWCFIKAPYVRRDESPEQVLVERVFIDSEGRLLSSVGELPYKQPIYNISLELRSTEKGDQIGKGRGAIENAITQVCRGLNGMVEFLEKHPKVLGSDQYIIPVIFTTAQIFTSEVNISNTDLSSGQLDLKTMEAVEKKGWIWFRYHLSSGLKHSICVNEIGKEISDILDMEYARTIAIVSANSIEDFLKLSLRTSPLGSPPTLTGHPPS